MCAQIQKQGEKQVMNHLGQIQTEQKMNRFYTITDILAEKEVTSSLVVDNGSLPYMEIPLEDTSSVMGLYYDAKSDKEEESFTLIAECVIAVEDENLRNCMVEKINEENEPYYCIVSSNGEILLRGMFETESTEGAFANGVGLNCYDIIL